MCGDGMRLLNEMLINKRQIRVTKEEKNIYNVGNFSVYQRREYKRELFI